MEEGIRRLAFLNCGVSKFEICLRKDHSQEASADILCESLSKAHSFSSQEGAIAHGMSFLSAWS